MASTEPGLVRLVRDIVSQGVQVVPPADCPRVVFPPGTTLFFSESAAGAGQFEVTYRGSVGETAKDVTTLELAAPQWLLSLLMRDEVIKQKEQMKLSFTLSPWKDPVWSAANGRSNGSANGNASFGHAPEPMPELPTGNARLTATQMLRIKKVSTYVVEKLGMQTSRPRDDSIAGSRRPSAAPTAMSPSASSVGTAAGAQGATDTASAQDLVEILCDDVVLPPSLTLVQCRRFLWKQSGDIKLEYRMRSTA